MREGSARLAGPAPAPMEPNDSQALQLTYTVEDPNVFYSRLWSARSPTGALRFPGPNRFAPRTSSNIGRE